MKKLSYACMLLVSAWSFQSCSNPNEANKDSADNALDMNKKNDPVAGDDSKFAVEAASGGLLEVAMGKMAVEKSQDKRIQNFGSMLVTDHTKANNELKDLAGNKNIALPVALGEDAQKHIEAMGKKAGKEFDKDFMSMMVDDHKDDISKFESAADKATDVDLKSFAAKTLPTLRMHLDSAKAIHDAVK